ncbi:MAG: EamA family transporter [Patescibacteria group bacterium]
MWFYIALSAAFVSGILVVLNKRILNKVDPVILFWTMIVISTTLMSYFALKDGIPNLSVLFIVGVLCSTIFYTLSRITQFRAIKDAPISQIYPIIILSPIVTMTLAFLPPLSERPSLISLAGSMVSLVGIYTINVSTAKEGLLEPFKILVKNKYAFLMLISVIALGFVSVFDKIAILGTFPKNVIFTLFIENMVIIIGLLPYLFARRSAVISQISMNIWVLLALGVLFAMGNILGFVSIGGGNVGIVTALFRSQVFFALLFSFIFFKDKPKLETIIGSLILIFGVVLVKIGL